MSNEWNLLCRTCDHIHRFDWNHGGDKIQQLIPLLPGLKGTGPALDFLSVWRPGDFDVLQLSGLVDFAERHGDHDLIAIDEYGREHDHCGKEYRCSCCDRYANCRKPVRHEDACGPDKFVPMPGILVLPGELTGQVETAPLQPTAWNHGLPEWIGGRGEHEFGYVVRRIPPAPHIRPDHGVYLSSAAGVRPLAEARAYALAILAATGWKADDQEAAR